MSSGLSFAEQSRTRALSGFTSTQVIGLLCSRIRKTTRARICTGTFEQLTRQPIQFIALGILQNLPLEVDVDMIAAQGVTDIEHLEAIASFIGLSGETQLLHIWAWGNSTIAFKDSNSAKSVKDVGYANMFIKSLNAIVQDLEAKPSATEMLRKEQFKNVSHWCMIYLVLSYVLIGVVLFFCFSFFLVYLSFLK